MLTKLEAQTALGLVAVVCIMLLGLACVTDSPTAPSPAPVDHAGIADAGSPTQGPMPDIRTAQPPAGIVITLRDVTPYGYWRKQRIDARVTAGVRSRRCVLRVRRRSRPPIRASASRAGQSRCRARRGTIAVGVPSR